MHGLLRNPLFSVLAILRVVPSILAASSENFRKLAFTYSTMLRANSLRIKRQYTESEVDGIFSTALSSILEATRLEFKQEATTLGIAFPDYLSDETRQLQEVAARLVPDLAKSIVVWSVRKGYRLDTATALGYSKETDIDQEDSLLLHFDYQNTLLEVSITIIGTNVTSREGYFQVADYGGPTQLASIRIGLSSLLPSK
ncbi:uncharacterized protein RSE6_07485 [Rhynchosporium secalis]|uniref:Uncharacterized protein n=1 Tax=Rhynchosporium secalis TaxID=38038 RepID=A0A1E1MD10_RHYSE|nr:uncharacterized protein RSE6_07485 [Rhynchosporium secalis]